MKKHIVLWAAVLAALILIGVIIGITAFSSPPDKGDEIIIEPQPVATPEVVALQTAVPTVTPEPILKPVPTEEAKETPTPTKKPASTAKSGAAFTLKIKDRTISVAKRRSTRLPAGSPPQQAPDRTECVWYTDTAIVHILECWKK